MHNVHLLGGDNVGWALDDDLARTREALEGVVNLVPVEESEILHVASWSQLLRLPSDLVADRRVICHLTGEPARLLGVPGFERMRDVVGFWVAQSRQAEEQWTSLIGPCVRIPYAVDTDTFYPVDKDRPVTKALRVDLGIPEGAYVIASFQRDSLGSALDKPKLDKGPDVFFEIVNRVYQTRKSIHVLLAGPRRHCLRNKLDEARIPYTFVGKPIGGDDIKENTLTRESLARLYAIADLYVVGSRTEGGPRALLEAAACKCKIISRPVGLAPDVLQTASLFGYPDEASNLILADIENGGLDATIQPNFNAVIARHTPLRAQEMFRNLYEDLDSIPASEAPKHWPGDAIVKRRDPHTWYHLLRRYVRLPRPTVSIWHKCHRPPWGGGNQFLLALRKGLMQRKVKVVSNRVPHGAWAHIFNAVTFDTELFERRIKGTSARVIHRVDGPYHTIRNKDEHLDQLMHDINRRYADVTIIQSMWCAKKLKSYGYEFKNIVLLPNASDPDIFFPSPARKLRKGERIRLIATSWSAGKNKGGDVYKWLEENLDWDRFEFTFVGNSSVSFTRSQHIDAVDSKKLAGILREQDIYITASRNDPCSNALIEAQSCGLPALYYNDGGHPELVGLGGLPFSNNDELLTQLDRLADNYEMFSHLVAPPDYEYTMERYFQLCKPTA